jgi:hypothetical protein
MYQRLLLAFMLITAVLLLYVLVTGQADPHTHTIGEVAILCGVASAILGYTLKRPGRRSR